MLKVTNMEGTPWTVRVVQKGDAYGREDCLTHEEDRPMIEFYDARYTDKFGERGQFVSRYYLETLQCDKCGRSSSGLDLYSSEPSWWLDGETLDYALKWATKEVNHERLDSRTP